MSLAIDATFQADPAQLGNTQYYADPNTVDNHLVNDVHPLWVYRNWSRDIRIARTPRVEGPESMRRPLTRGEKKRRHRKLPVEIFERILPAVRLASLFLEKSLPWFWRLRYASLDTIGRHGQRVLKRDEGVWTPGKEAQIREELELIAEQYYLFHGVFGWDMQGTGISAYSFLTIDANLEPEPDEYKWRGRVKKAMLSGVAQESIDLIGSDKWLGIPLAIQHRCLFSLAVLLVHELAHCVGFSRPEGTRVCSEPYVYASEPARETGFSWEFYMFGGQISVVDGEMSGNAPDAAQHSIRFNHPDWQLAGFKFHSHVMMFSDWTNRKSNMNDLCHPPGRWLIASKSIEQFFDRRPWAQWLAMDTATAPGRASYALSPFSIHLSPSVFMTIYDERSLSYSMWYYNRLRGAATNFSWSAVLDYESYYSDSEYHEFGLNYTSSDETVSLEDAMETT